MQRLACRAISQMALHASTIFTSHTPVFDAHTDIYELEWDVSNFYSVAELLYPVGKILALQIFDVAFARSL